MPGHWEDDKRKQDEDGREQKGRVQMLGGVIALRIIIPSRDSRAPWGGTETLEPPCLCSF